MEAPSTTQINFFNCMIFNEVLPVNGFKKYPFRGKFGGEKQGKGQVGQHLQQFPGTIEIMKLYGCISLGLIAMYL